MSFLNLIKQVEKDIQSSSKVKRGRKPKSNILSNDIEISHDYRPAGWKESPLSFAETITAYAVLKKKKKDLTDEEKIIVHNYEILKSCYRTTKHILKLAKIFIGAFNFDPYFNHYGFTGTKEFATEDFVSLSGYSSEDDGFSLSNWQRITINLEEISAFINPPFNRLEEASTLVNNFAEHSTDHIAFLTTLDYTNYLQDCLRNADYFIMLGRVNFLPLPRINTSSPRGSVGLSIYNSKIDIGDSRFISFEGSVYYCVNLKKERQTKNLSQLTMDDLLKSLTPEELALVPKLDPEKIEASIEKGKKDFELIKMNGVRL